MAVRADELAQALALVADAARERSGALLVSGEAGIGKTSLLREVCAATRALVLWAPCLPLTSLSVPFLPLRTALRDVPRPPRLDTADAVLEFDGWLDRRAREETVLLVVDDVQWADRSSLDVLMYVIAGRADRRLAVLVTLRTGDEHRLHGWLADVRRLPRVREIRLDRLDRVSTAQQIGALLGRPPYESLVDDVHGRSRGNPYLTTLLVRGLAPDARALPERLPTELRDALARAWQDLSEPARRLTTVIAVAGRPRPADGAGAVPLLREAVDAGVLRVDADGCYWFAHPLLAEVLVAALLPEERRALHAELAETATDPIERADHYHRAGRRELAYEWALVAADTAETGGGAAEAVRLLRRAARLRPPHADESAVDLLHRIRRAAQRSGRSADELPAVEELLDRVDQPLARTELLIRRTVLRFALGIEFAGVADAYEAVRLSAAWPASREHALAKAQLALVLIWHAEQSGIAGAEDALRLARAGGWPQVIGYAQVAVSRARTATGDLDGAAEAAREAQAIGIRTGDPDLAVSGSYEVGNTADGTSLRDFIEAIRRCRQDLERIGAPHSHVSEISSTEAEGLLQVGDWRSCLERLRVTLGARPGIRADARARNVAALLASRQGRHAEAAAHAARAEELIMEGGGFLVIPFDSVRAELAVAAGEDETAITHALHGLSRYPPPVNAETLLPLAVRALANLAQASRDRGVDPAPELARLRELRKRYPEIVTEPGANAKFLPRWRRAMQALADAETARCRQDPDEDSSWQAAADACRDAEVSWDEAYCRLREAQAAMRDRKTRGQGAAALRRAYAIATDLDAGPLLAELDLLARNAHVPTATVADPPPAETVPGLTAREREILAHVVAGRTYREIAAALVLSEKTVSAHISNMLRKTGTASRIELAQLAGRHTSERRTRVPGPRT